MDAAYGKDSIFYDSAMDKYSDQVEIESLQCITGYLGFKLHEKYPELGNISSSTIPHSGKFCWMETNAKGVLTTPSLFSGVCQDDWRHLQWVHDINDLQKECDKILLKRLKSYIKMKLFKILETLWSIWFWCKLM